MIMIFVNRRAYSRRPYRLVDLPVGTRLGHGTGQLQEDALQIGRQRGQLADEHAAPGQRLGDPGRVGDVGDDEVVFGDVHAQPGFRHDLRGRAVVGHADAVLALVL
jgi:hypothetical protein